MIVEKDGESNKITALSLCKERCVDKMQTMTGVLIHLTPKAVRKTVI